MKNTVPCRIVGHFNNCPVFIRTYPTYVELSCNGCPKRFRTYSEAMTYLQSITVNRGRGRTDHESITGQSQHK